VKPGSGDEGPVSSKVAQNFKLRVEQRNKNELRQGCMEAWYENAITIRMKQRLLEQR
jgi:hypothetical protein